MAGSESLQAHMCGCGYANLEGRWITLHCTSNSIQLLKDDRTELKSITTSEPLTCLAVNPLSDVVVVGEGNFVKVRPALILV